jgi:hypothetical protein
MIRYERWACCDPASAPARFRALWLRVAPVRDPANANARFARMADGVVVDDDDDDFEDVGVNPRHQLASAHDLDEDDDEEEAGASTINPRRGPRKDVKKPGSKPRTSSDIIDYGFDQLRPLAVGSDTVVRDAIANVAKETGAPFFKPTKWKSERKTGWNKGWQTRNHRCSFWHESECRYMVMERRKLGEGAFVHEAYKPGFGAPAHTALTVSCAKLRPTRAQHVAPRARARERARSR